MLSYDKSGNKNEYAENIISYLKYEAVRIFAPFGPVVKMLEPFCVDEYEPEEDRLDFENGNFGFGKNRNICTDGLHLFYYSEKLISSFIKSPGNLISLFLHILIHIIALDIDRRKSAADRWTFDHEVNKKDREMMKRYFPLYLLRENAITDTHMWWDRLHPLLREKGKSEKVIIEGIQEKRSKAVESAKALMSDFCLTIGNDPFGKSFDVKAKKSSGLSYEEILLKNLSDGAGRVKCSDEIFDYNWYQIGMEEYDSHPFIEAYEDTERPEYILRDIVIAIDTSGSCVDYGSGFISETFNILNKNRLLGNGVCIMECDAEVHNVAFVRNTSELNRYLKTSRLHGAGGTDFVPVFEKIRELRENGSLSKKINALLYFSDGQGRFPENGPDYPVWFAIPEDSQDLEIECPDYVKKIVISKKQMKRWEER